MVSRRYKCLWLLIWLVNEVAVLLVVCQLSCDVIGCEDCKENLLDFCSGYRNVSQCHLKLNYIHQSCSHGLSSSPPGKREEERSWKKGCTFTRMIYLWHDSYVQTIYRLSLCNTKCRASINSLLFQQTQKMDYIHRSWLTCKPLSPLCPGTPSGPFRPYHVTKMMSQWACVLTVTIEPYHLTGIPSSPVLPGIPLLPREPCSNE